MPFAAEALELESLEVQEEFFERGWTDGLPIVPPTPELVGRFLDAGLLPADRVVGTIRERAVEVRAEGVAINAVMSGCRPEYAPVVFAAVRALTNPDHNANGVLTSTGGPAICAVVSGPTPSGSG